MNQYRIMQTDKGKYVAQVKKGFFSDWDDIFYAGVLGLVEHSIYKLSYREHNNRYSDTIRECESIIEAHKRKEYERENKHLTQVK